jgi:hypothetical protein
MIAGTLESLAAELKALDSAPCNASYAHTDHMGHSWRSFASRLAFVTLFLGCAQHPALTPKPSSPLRAPSYMRGALVASGCGADRTEVPDTLISVVDVLIDSVTDNGLNEMRLLVSFAPKSEPGLVRPNISAGIAYPVEGRPFPREVSSGCPWVEGITLRVNASRVSRAALTIDATGPVRISIRSMAGFLLANPILVQSGSVPYTIRWGSWPRTA